MIDVLIVDDKEPFRRALRFMLELEADIAVVGEAGDGFEAVVRARQFRPDVVLMDLRMPGMDGIEAARAIRAQLPGIRILMLTVSDEEADVLEAVKAGAIGYLLKEVSVEEVVDAVRSVMAGTSLISPAIASSVMDELGDGAAIPTLAASPRLDPREVDVLRLVALGRANDEIAEELGVTEETVRRHVANILLKLQLRARVEEAVAALRANLQDTGDPGS